MTSISGFGASSAAQALQQQLQSAFKKADADGNGTLSKSEFTSFISEFGADSANGVQGSAAPTATGGSSALDSLFSSLDGNGDGSLSLGEVEQAPAQAQQLSSDTLTAILKFLEEGGSHHHGKGADGANALTATTDDSTTATGSSDPLAGLLQNVIAQYTQAAGTLTGTSAVTDTADAGSVSTTA